MPDLESYNNIWLKGILPLLRYYCKQNKWITMSMSETEIKKEIYDNYRYFNDKCRNYMSSDIERLDRHKVSACYILAIIKSEPLSYESTELTQDTVAVATEQIAISIGLKILQGFITSKYDRHDNTKPDNEYKRDLAIFENGFVYPDQDDINHGIYRDNFAIELYFTVKEKNYNILSLSHSLYLLELFNRLKYDLKESKRDRN